MKTITPNQQRNSFLLLLLALLFMGFAAVGVKASAAPGIVTVFYRLSIATVVLIVPFIIHLMRAKWRLPRKGILLALAAGGCFGADMTLWSTGVTISNATFPTLTANLAPIWVGIGAVLVFKERLKPGFWLGIMLSIIGIAIMVNHDIKFSVQNLKGLSLGLIAGVFYGIFYLLAQGGRKQLGTLPFLFLSSLASTFTIALVFLFTPYSLTGYPAQTWFIFLYLGLGVQVISWYCINHAQGFLPASVVAPTLLGQPVLTAIFAVVLLGEVLTVRHIFGGLIVVAGIYVVHFSRSK